MRRGCRFVVGLVILVAVAGISVPRASAAFGPPALADANPPAGTILNPLPGAWQGNPYIYLQVGFTDPDGIATSSLYMAIDGMSLVTNWNSFVLYASASGLADGPHTAEARASDQLGNGPTVLSWSFSLDTTRPEVEITNPAGNPVLADGSVILRWTGTDTGSGIDRYEVRLDNGLTFDVGNATSFPFHNLEPGIHYFHVRAYDVAGNSDPYYEIAVATVPPAAPPPPNPANTTLVVSLPSEVPSWAVALIAINVVELAAIVGLAFRQRKEPRGSNRPNE